LRLLAHLYGRIHGGDPPGDVPDRAEHEMTHLDLCSGIGGFHLAAEWAGFRTVGFSEIEPYCCKLLAEKWAEIKNYGDLRTADFSGLRGTITVLSAGVPCQPASLAGKRRGAGDDRWLWPAVLDVVERVEPAWCIFENPPGILTLGEFEGVLLRLESLGYEVRAFSVPANAVGAKHLRYRIFVVAYTTSVRSQRRGIGRREAPGKRECYEASGPSQNSEALADTAEGRLRCSREGTRGSGLRSEGETLADAAGARCREGQPRASGAIWDEARRPEFDGRGFAAVAIRDFPGLTEPPLCRAADGIRNRSHRLKALGNSVVPQQAYPFFEAIAEICLCSVK
jgi:DNA (cytosine-5)-methyltransferase 1